jgi:tRNA pseudouridine55 synthase
MAAPDGLIIVDKPADWTSHDVVSRCRRLAETRKVGHAGTLDPMATGVLVIGVGRATRLLGHLALSTKGYDATIRLGQSTITDDAEGDLVDSTDASAVTDAQLQAAVQELTGDVEQVPSSVSAVKINGERAYKRVREGETVVIPARPVTVMDFAVVAVRRHDGLVDADVHVECSKGTYVRALARDLGVALGVGGHLTALRRTRVGPYALDQAHSLDQLAEHLVCVSLDDIAAANFATYTIDDERVPAVRNGRALHLRLDRAGGHVEPAELPSPEPVAVMSPTGEFLALYAQHGPVAHAVAVFAPA